MKKWWRWCGKREKVSMLLERCILVVGVRFLGTRMCMVGEG